MNNLTNYHSHCSLCDGHAPMEVFVKRAINLGFSSYGVSSHAPLPFPTRWTLEKENVPTYLEELARLKTAYQGKIELYAGMEIDYLDEDHHPGNEYFNSLPLDYRIGSVHLVYSSEGEVVDLDSSPETFRENLHRYFQGDLRYLVNLYYDKLMKMVETGGFDFVGHADKISYNASCCDAGVLEQPWYNRKINSYFELIASKQIMVEINTKAFVATGFFFPNRKHFNLLRKLNIPLLVNSDAHYPERINDSRTEALSALRQTGIHSVRELKQGKWTDVEIG